ncbi:MAG: hypothetical protein WBF95_08915 [Comamonas thiooxydans]
MQEQKKQCAVRGLLASPMRGIPGAMCGHIIVSGKQCGFAGQCEHQREPETNAQRAAQAAQGGE